MTDLDYVKSCFPFGKFNKELYNAIEIETEKLIKKDKKFETFKRGILYNTYRILKDIMVTDILGINFYQNTDNIHIQYKCYSCNAGIITKEKIIRLELAY